MRGEGGTDDKCVHYFIIYTTPTGSFIQCASCLVILKKKILKKCSAVTFRDIDSLSNRFSASRSRWKHCGEEDTVSIYLAHVLVPPAPPPPPTHLVLIVGKGRRAVQIKIFFFLKRKKHYRLLGVAREGSGVCLLALIGVAGLVLAGSLGHHETRGRH